MTEPSEKASTGKTNAGVEAVERALRIMETCAAQPKGITLADLSRRTGFYKSTILRIATSLEKFNYLERDTGSVFRLGPAAWHLGRQYGAAVDLEARVRPALKQLCRDTGETASYFIREGDSRLCLFREEPERAIRHSVLEGARLPLDLSASAQVLAAAGGADKTREATGEHLEADDPILSLGARDPALAAFAVAVRVPEGVVMAALALSGPITRFTEAARPAMIAALLSCRERLAVALTL